MRSNRLPYRIPRAVALKSKVSVTVLAWALIMAPAKSADTMAVCVHVCGLWVESNPLAMMRYAAYLSFTTPRLYKSRMSK